MIRTSRAAAEIDKPLRAQSRAPDVYSKFCSRIRESVCDCKCNSINYNQTNMNSLCNRRSVFLPSLSKSSLCCSHTLRHDLQSKNFKLAIDIVEMTGA